MQERYKSVVVSDLMLTRERDGKTEVLLSLRKNTGNNDGEFGLPGGHVEKNEDLIQAVIRESKEELDIDLKREDLKIIYIMHHYTGERINFILCTEQYEGKIKINEPDKCEKLEWFNIKQLPENTTSKVKKIIKDINNNIFYNYM